MSPWLIIVIIGIGTFLFRISFIAIWANRACPGHSAAVSSAARPALAVSPSASQT